MSQHDDDLHPALTQALGFRSIADLEAGMVLADREARETVLLQLDGMLNVPHDEAPLRLQAQLLGIRRDLGHLHQRMDRAGR